MFHDTEAPKYKQRRLERSCDLCRKRKSDGPKNPDGRCSHCLAFGSPCTYIEPSKKRGPKSPEVEELKRKVAGLEAKLRALSICSLCARPLQTLPDMSDGTSSVFSHSTPGSDSTTSGDASKEADQEDEEDLADNVLASRFRRIAIDPRTFGSGSSFALANNAIVAKEKLMGRPGGQGPPSQSRRPMYWQTPSWEKEVYDRQPRYVYPDNDLLSSLLHLYFTNIHPVSPILHRPSFERFVADGLHLRNPQFGATLLAALALGSRYSNDPRVFADGHSTLSSGWKFVQQVKVVRKYFEPTLFEVQFYFLMTLYSIGTSKPSASWVYLGLCIRFLQQHNEHHQKRKTPTDLEEELWNRAFWMCLCIDRMWTAFIGRPTAFHVEDYTADPPLEVDDEFWEQGFTQPQERPYSQSFFQCYIQLSEVLGDTMRRLYGSKKKKLLIGWTGPNWEQQTVAELDSEMNRCFDSIPPHLRWGPEKLPQEAFFDQSYLLFVLQNYVSIMIHRPYINKQSALAAPSLSICARAARSIIQAADIWVQVRQRLAPNLTISPIFVASIILTMNTLAEQRIGTSKDKALITKAMQIIKVAETRWLPCGRFWEMLNQLQSMDVTVPSKPTSPDGGSAPIARASPPITRASPPITVPDPPAFIPFRPAVHFVPSVQTEQQYSHHGPQSVSYGHMPTTPWSTNAEPVPLGIHDHGLKPGMTIEELLAETGDLDFFSPSTVHDSSDDMVVDEKLVSMWMAAPTDFSDPGQWGRYFHTQHPTWTNNFVPQQQRQFS